LIWLLLPLAALALVWAFSRAAVLVIDRTWPPRGTIHALGARRLHVLDRAGPPGAPSVLLIHGASGNLRDQDEALGSALESRFRVIAIDRPGHGHSSRGHPGMSDPGRQADVIAELLAAIGVPAAIVLGHSWGAAVAAALAVRHPDKVAGLVLLAPATHPWPGGVSRRSRFFARPVIGPVAAALAVVPIGLRVIGRAVPIVFAPEAAPADYARRIGAHLALRPKTFVANARDVVHFYGHVVRLSARYGDIRAPTEVVTGDRDRVVAPAIHSYGLVRDIPGARLTILPGVGHMPHWTAAAAAVAAIERVAARSQAFDRAAE